MLEETLNIVVCGVGGQGTVLAARLLAQCALDGGAQVRSAETIGMAQRGGSVLGHIRITPSTLPEKQDELHELQDQQNQTQQPRHTGCQSPLVPRGQAQLLIGFEPAETLRAYPFCSKHALVITATAPLPPPTASLQRLAYDGEGPLAVLRQEKEKGALADLILVNNVEIMDQLGFDKALNVVLLGAALGALEKQRAGGLSQGFSSKSAATGKQNSSVAAVPGVIHRSVADVLSYDRMGRTIEKTVKQKFVEPNLRALKMGYQLACT